MRLKSFLRALFVFVIVFICTAWENAYAEKWVKCDDGVYYDADNYHIDPISEIEYWRIKIVFNNDIKNIQHWEYNMKTKTYKHRK